MTEMHPQPKRVPVRDAKFLAFVRSHRCAIKGRSHHRCANRDHIGTARIEAAHLSQPHGIGSKGDDTLTIPLCELAHYIQHDIGWLTFQERFGIDGYAINAELQTVWKARQR